MKARFVSQIRNLTVGVRTGRESQLGADGRMAPAVPTLEAVFEHSLATKADIEAAKSGMHFHGLMQLDNGQDFGHGLRVSVFDAEHAQLQNGWSDEDTALVVETLRNIPSGDFIEVEVAAAEKPWNRYDELEDPERIVELAREFGADAQSVIAYEVENRNRPQVIEPRELAIDEIEEAVVSA